VMLIAAAMKIALQMTDSHSVYASMNTSREFVSLSVCLSVSMTKGEVLVLLLNSSVC